MRNLRNNFAYQNSLWDWTPLNECFQGTNIRVTDIDGLVERHGKFLVIETKSLGEEIPQGQSLTFDALLRTGAFTIILVWGKCNAPEEIRVLTRNERNNRHYLKADIQLLKKIVSEWFHFANQQQPSINLPKSGSHVNSFAWDKSTLLVEALGHEGPCDTCGEPMNKGRYFRVADGRITHLECVRNWESPVSSEARPQPRQWA